MKSKDLQSIFIKPQLQDNLEEVFDFLTDFQSERKSYGMSIGGFDYNSLYQLAERRNIELDSYLYFVKEFEHKMLKSERKDKNGK